MPPKCASEKPGHSVENNLLQGAGRVMVVVARGRIDPPMPPTLPLEKNTKRPDKTAAARFSADKSVSKKQRFAGDFSQFLVCRGRENDPED